ESLDWSAASAIIALVRKITSNAIVRIMVPYYHKIFVAQASCLWGPAAILPAIATPLGTADTTALEGLGSCLTLRPPRNFLLFIYSFPSLEDGAGGIYRSGQSPNPAQRRHLSIDPS